MATRQKSPKSAQKKTAPVRSVTARKPKSILKPRKTTVRKLIENRAGRILTFYSYKGGTGRSMALANIAWILASNRKRVLVIDWDLEAPGLHRYFSPFLPDADLTQSNGLIDFFSDFAEVARLEKLGVLSNDSSTDGTAWYDENADLLRFAVSLEYPFAGAGTIDFIPSGRQGTSYGIRVAAFNWPEFYDKLGGGIFLEAVKKRLRAEYDYILIDSRTGLSDTSGICTVQMPDELVVFFTLNRQSMLGAAAAAESAIAQRRKPTGEPVLKVWPVPTRIDNAEKERLEAARQLARQTFAQFPWHLSKRERESYWSNIEIPYLPFYAYEEILATLADSPRLSSSLLASMEHLTQAITQGSVSHMPFIKEETRLKYRDRFYSRSDNSMSPQALRLYISYTKKDLPENTVKAIIAALELEFGFNNVFWDEKIALGEPWEPYLSRKLQEADCVLVLIGAEWKFSRYAPREVRLANTYKKVIVPVLMGEKLSWSEVPPGLRSIFGVQIDFSNPDIGIDRLIKGLNSLPKPLTVRKILSDLEDPQKYQWGGKSNSNGRRLSAKVTTVSKNWFRIVLTVVGSASIPLEGDVEFHLHPSFTPNVEKVSVLRGKATLVLHAYGAFTVGCVVDNGKTHLELDLSTLQSAPKIFRER